MVFGAAWETRVGELVSMVEKVLERCHVHHADGVCTWMADCRLCLADQKHGKILRLPKAEGGRLFTRKMEGRLCASYEESQRGEGGCM